MPLKEFEKVITSVVETAAPSVVGISTVRVLRDHYLRPFPVEGMGSGVVIDKEGLIVTNDHVVRKARSAAVIMSDGSRHEAEFLGGDAEYDIALLRANAERLQPAKLGDSDALRVGQLAIAIGSPFGHVLNGPTVTTGVVSALKRSLRTERGIAEDLIQSDAPINPGNSGGPLLNSDGEVIGINTAIIPVAQGIGFAIPVNTVKAIVEQVLHNGHVAHAWLGISGVTVTPQVASQYELPVERGVLVFEAERGSPARAAGIGEGDLLVELNGRDLASIEELRSHIRRQKPGERLELGVARERRRERVEVALAERPPETTRAR